MIVAQHNTRIYWQIAISSVIVNPVGMDEAMIEQLQHLLHPLNLWSRLGGRWIKCFRLYETYLWQPILRRWLNNKSMNGNMSPPRVIDNEREETSQR